jgi:N-acetylglucosaminyl-diphospho-decaprenol L-rhamnosyltransferase
MLSGPPGDKVDRVSPNVPNRSRPPASLSPLLTVVIVNYNGWPDVLRLVASLAEEPEVGSGRCEVVVVDNATPGPIPVEMTVPRPGVRLFSRRENGGFAAGVNAGWRASKGPWLLVLNPDVVVPPGLLGRVTSRIEHVENDSREAPGVVGFGLRNPDGTRQPSVGSFPSLPRTVWEQLIPRSRRKYQAGWRTRSGPVDWVTGACVLVNTATLRDLGGMDEDFFLYYEEVALCRAARRLGWRVEYDSSVEVVHLHPLQNRPILPMMRVITRHSKLLYFRKHLPHWQFVGLSWIVSAEVLLRSAWSRAQGWDEDARAWRTIGEVTRRLRAGMELRGRDVLVLAEAATARVEPPESRGFPNAVVSARKR